MYLSNGEREREGGSIPMIEIVESSTMLCFKLCISVTRGSFSVYMCVCVCVLYESTKEQHTRIIDVYIGGGMEPT